MYNMYSCGQSFLTGEVPLQQTIQGIRVNAMYRTVIQHTILLQSNAGYKNALRAVIGNAFIYAI